MLRHHRILSALCSSIVETIEMKQLSSERYRKKASAWNIYFVFSVVNIAHRFSAVLRVSHSSLAFFFGKFYWKWNFVIVRSASFCDRSGGENSIWILLTHDFGNIESALKLSQKISRKYISASIWVETLLPFPFGELRQRSLLLRLTAEIVGPRRCKNTRSNRYSMREKA